MPSDPLLAVTILFGDTAVYNGPGNVGATVQERGRMPGHDRGSTEIPLTS